MIRHNFVNEFIINTKTVKYFDNPNLDYIITIRIDDNISENDFIKNIQIVT